MKHQSRSRVESQLLGDLQELGIPGPVDARATDEILDYLYEVLRLNETVNVTAVTDIDDAARLHLVDSLAAIPALSRCPEGLLVDIGTGGGFPGVPLAVWSGRPALLIDSVGRKIRVVEEALGVIGEHSDIRTAVGRAEEVAVDHPGVASVVVARAVTTLPALVELAAPLLAPEGVFLALKADVSEDELTRGSEAAHIVGLVQDAVERYALPRTGESRSVISYRRVAEPSVRLPRRVGKAQKSPLA